MVARGKKTKRYQLINDYHLLAYESVDSTNQEARRLAEAGASHGAVVWAKEQTAGRGRLQREWESKLGNLFVSVLLSPDCGLQAAAQLSFVASLASAEALQPLLPGDGVFTCKWPNDILLGDQKLGGILLESFTTLPEEAPKNAKPKQWVVVGVGLNIDSYPKDAMYPATCLKEAGVELVSAKIVLIRWIERFMACYDLWTDKGFAPIRKNWLSHAYGVGEKAVVMQDEEKLEGIFSGINTKGEMQLKTENGKTQRINCGDVFFDAVKAITTHA